MFGKSKSDEQFFDAFLKHGRVTLEAAKLIKSLFDELHNSADLARAVSEAEHSGEAVGDRALEVVGVTVLGGLVALLHPDDVRVRAGRSQTGLRGPDCRTEIAAAPADDRDMHRCVNADLAQSGDDIVEIAPVGRWRRP